MRADKGVVENGVVVVVGARLPEGTVETVGGGSPAHTKHSVTPLPEVQDRRSGPTPANALCAEAVQCGFGFGDDAGD